MSEALQEYFAIHDGISGDAQVTTWIDKNYPGRWKQGTLRDHLYGGQVNNPKAYQHHPSQKKFFFAFPHHRYELHDPRKHGVFREGRIIIAGATPGWILVHGEDHYGPGKKFLSPQDELRIIRAHRRANLLWQWIWPKPPRESADLRQILLAWEGEVFGEAIAAVTHHTEDPGFDFSFILKKYFPIKPSIPLSRLRLGSRLRNHRSLIRLEPENVAAFYKARPSDSTDLIEAKELIEAAADPNRFPKRKRRGLFRNALERKAIEDRAMEVGEAYLKRMRFSRISNVSKVAPFDYTARKNGRDFIVEIKGTTGEGVEIILTHGEVKAHGLRHPYNLLLIVHSIVLTKVGKNTVATGGVIRAIARWKIDSSNLTPLSYSYILPPGK